MLTLWLKITLVTIIGTLPGNCWQPARSVRIENSCTNRFGGVDGVIQVFCNGTWSYINGSDWDYADARVACKELGYEGVARLYRNTTTFTIPKRSRRFDFSPAKFIPAIINGIKCLGDERDILDCIVEGAKNVLMDEPNPGSNHTVDDVACVSCTDMKTARLTGGSGPQEGRVEVFYDDHWGTVCDDGWGMEDADVLCKELGYPGALSALGSAAFGTGNHDERIWMDDTECCGNESSLSLCQKERKWGDHNCIHAEDASAICATNATNMSCPMLPTISHTSASTECTDVGTEVCFVCDEGFVMLGANKIKCLPSGQWSWNTPFCIPPIPEILKPTSCPQLPEIAHANVSSRSTAIGATVHFQCDIGFMLFGHNNITCTTLGMWNGMPPVCLVEYMNFCPELPVPANADASFYDEGKEEVVKYKCNTGYTMIGFEKISCLRYGYMAQWNGAPPMCVPTAKYMLKQPGPNALHDSQQNSGAMYHKNISVGAAVGISIGVILAVVLATVVLGTVYWHFSNRKKRENEVLNNLSSPLLEVGENGN